MNLEDRLANWGAVWRIRLRSNALFSKESAYRSAGARHWDYATGTGVNGVHLGTAPSSPLRGDPIDAAQVERAVGAIDIYHAVMLKGHYIRVWDPDKTIREARKAVGDRSRRRGDYDASMAMARALLAEVIDRPAVIRRQRAEKAVALALQLPTWDEAYA